MRSVGRHVLLKLQIHIIGMGSGGVVGSWAPAKKVSHWCVPNQARTALIRAAVLIPGFSAMRRTAHGLLASVSALRMGQTWWTLMAGHGHAKPWGSVRYQLDNGSISNVQPNPKVARIASVAREQISNAMQKTTHLQLAKLGATLNMILAGLAQH